jgi:hypothetical protein
MAILQGISGLTKTAASVVAKAGPQVGDVALKVSKVALKNPQAAAGVAVFGAQVAIDLGNNYVVKPTTKAIKQVDDAYDSAMSTITGHQEGPINAVIEMQNKLKEIDAMISTLSVSTKAVLDGKKTDSVRLFASPNIKEIMKWANWNSEGKVIIAAIKNFLGLSAYLAKGTAEFGAEVIKIEFKLGKEHFFENIATLWSILMYIASTRFYSNCVTGAFIYSFFRLYFSNRKGKSVNKQKDKEEQTPRRYTRRRAHMMRRRTIRITDSPPSRRSNSPHSRRTNSPPPAEEAIPLRRSSRRHIINVPVPTTTQVIHSREVEKNDSAESENIDEDNEK